MSERARVPACCCSVISVFSSRLIYEEILTLKAPRKKLPNITDELSIKANSVDPEKTAPIGAVWSGSTLFAIEAS